MAGKINVPAGSPQFLTNLAREVERGFVPTVPTAPVKLAVFPQTDLPDASRWLGAVIWVSGVNRVAVSDGTHWYPLTTGAAL